MSFLATFMVQNKKKWKKCLAIKKFLLNLQRCIGHVMLQTGLKTDEDLIIDTNE